MASEHSFRQMLSEALDVLACEFRSGYVQFCNTLTHKCAHLCVDGEETWVYVDGDRVSLSAQSRSLDVNVTTSRTCVLNLIDGKSDWLESLTDDALSVKGPPDEVVWFFDVMQTFLKVTVRCPSMPEVLAVYRKGAV